MFVIWGLAVCCVVLTGLHVFLAYQADRGHEKAQYDAEQRHKVEQEQLTEKLEMSTRQQEYMRGQLDSIGLMVGKMGDSRNDAGLTKLAAAIEKMPRFPAGESLGSSQTRRLSEPQRAQLATLLKSGAGKRVLIYIASPPSERDRKERQDYARDLQAAFEQARWNVVVRNSEQADLNDYTGLLLAYFKGNPASSWPDFTLLKQAFNEADIKYTVSGLTEMDMYTGGATTADPGIYIGEK
jgi:hypothetical protein